MTAMAVLIGGLIVVCVLLVQSWALFQVHRQQARIQKRLVRLDRAIAARSKVAGGVPAPAFELATLDGGHVSRDALFARDKPVMLIVTDPRCGPCYELLPDIAGWQRVYGDRLTVVLVSAGGTERNRAMIAEYGIDPGLVLLQEAGEFRKAYGVEMAPSGILVTLDGRWSGEPALGAYEVREVVASALGLAVPDPPQRHGTGLKEGQAAPRFRRPDLDGDVIDLASYRGASLLLLFWSPGCSHCEALLPGIRSWETRMSGTRLLVVSRGPAALNRDVGLRTPMILDDDRSIAEAYSVTGTPAAVLIDRNGSIVGNVVRGERAVRALGDRVAGAEAPASGQAVRAVNPVTSSQASPGHV